MFREISSNQVVVQSWQVRKKFEYTDKDGNPQVYEIMASPEFLDDEQSWRPVVERAIAKRIAGDE